MRTEPLARRARAVLGRLKRRLRPPAPAPAAAKPPLPAKPPRPTRSQYPSLPGDRLLKRPVFILSSVRSGSTLLRVMLNSHSAVHAPHELHLGGVQVNLRDKHVRHAMAELGMDSPQLENLLADRLLHRELSRNGKTVLVNKTPSDVFRWRRIVECWPDARFIYLLRHPAATADSWIRAHPEWGRERVEGDVLRYMTAVESARTECAGLTVRYEDLTLDPERETKRICDFLELDWEPAMVDYGTADHGNFERQIGDWGEQIRSGKVQPVARLPEPEDIPERLREISIKWGYVEQAATESTVRPVSG